MRLTCTRPKDDQLSEATIISSETQQLGFENYANFQMDQELPLQNCTFSVDINLNEIF